ncbi:MAG: M67 family metallopeptidase [Anaerolineae bacterium]|nr:M67 family metallopeptidase [Anaerolineae bacterium]
MEEIAGTRLSLLATQYAEMLAHLRAAYPEEGCGLMAGRDGEVLQLYPVENMLHSRVAFEMEPYQQLQAFQSLEEAGWELLAIYHSHPHGPETPSAHDIAQAYYPEALSVIVSLEEPERPVVRAFAIRDGRVRECALAIS